MIPVPFWSYSDGVLNKTIMPTKFYIEEGHGCVYFSDGYELFYAPINAYGIFDLEESAPVDFADYESPEDEAQLLQIRDLLMPVQQVA
jgi:hypothetical protein